MAHANNLPYVDDLFNATTPFVNFFRFLGGDTAFPMPEDDASFVQGFLTSTLIFPGVILLIGLVLCIYLSIFLCCCKRKPVGELYQPSSKPVIIIGCLTIVAVIVGAIGGWETGGKSFHTAVDNLDDAVQDLKQGQTVGIKLQEDGKEILVTLDNLKTSCPAAIQQVIEQQLSGTTAQLEDSIALMKKYTDQIEPLTTKLSDVQKNEDVIGYVISWSLALPTALTGVSCLLIFVAVVATRGCGGPQMARCNDCCLMKFGAPFITFCVFVAASVACVEAAYGTVSASFCSDADQNVLGISQHVLGEDEFLAVKYYVSGEGTNPYNETLTDAMKSIESAGSDLSNALNPTTKDLIRSQCTGTDPDAVESKIDQDITAIKQSINAAVDIISRDEIYPYYKSIIRDDMCGTVIAWAAVMVILQLVVGLVALPVLATLSHNFFAKWVAWKERRDTEAAQVFVIDESQQAREVVSYA